MKNKLFKKLLTTGLPLALAACIFSGCASSDGGKSVEPPGTLTITGIPAEYEGKFVSFSFDMQNIAPVQIVASGKDPRALLARVEGAVIKDGEARLLLFVQRIIGGYTSYSGSDTFPVQLGIRDTAQSLQMPQEAGSVYEADFIFESVTFDKGAANMEWDKGFKVGSRVTQTLAPSPFSMLYSLHGIQRIPSV